MYDVVIVGAGLAGLTCARVLQARGVDCVLVESSDAVGGRVRTDAVEGFRLDRGFQVLPTAYPAAKAWLDYPGLQLGLFASGATVLTPEGGARVSDPWREPMRLRETLRAPVGTLGDKLRLGVLRLAATRGRPDEVWMRGLVEDGVNAARMRSTAEELTERGFSTEMTERFLRPWLGGVFLERELTTPAAMLFFVYRMFALGRAALPAGGMQRIPEQLAAGLRPRTLLLDSRVARLQADGVELLDGDCIRAKQVVLATDADEAGRLREVDSRRVWRSATCVYWAARQSPLRGDPVLWLNGTGHGRINNLTVPSDVAVGYAPDGQALISTTVVGDPNEDDEALTAALQAELIGYFGEEVRAWRQLGVYRVRRALPALSKPGAGEEEPRPLKPGLWVCGDHLSSASIQGAMAGGAATANAILGLKQNAPPR